MKQCYICGESDPSILTLEEHHLFGRKFGKQKIWLCLNCHKKITDEQNKLPTKIRKSHSSKSKLVFAINSIGALNKLSGEKLIQISHELSKDVKK